MPILQLRIELLHIEPLIWRRIQMPGDCTFWDLHVAIQSAFAWNDSHLHEFRRGGEGGNDLRFGIPLDDFDGDPPRPGWKHRVADVQTFADPTWRQVMLRYLEDPQHFNGVRRLGEIANYPASPNTELEPESQQ